MTLWERIKAILAAAHDNTLGAVMDEMDKRRREKDAGVFSIALIALSAKMAKADGVVTDDEIEAFGQFFAYPPEEAGRVQMLFRLAMEDVAGFDMYAKQVGKLFRRDEAVMEDVLDCLFHIALADGIAHPKEMELLRSAADGFHLSDRAWRRVRAAHLGHEQSDPYAILGVDPDTSDAEIRKAYLHLVRANHPDALVARGVPVELVKIAEGRMAAINIAYEKITADLDQARR